MICILIYWCLIFFTCARWAPALIQQAEHWRLCKSHLVFGFLEEVKTNLICPESHFCLWFCTNLCFLCAVSPSEGSAWFAEGPSSRWWMAFFCGRRKFTCMDGLRSSLFLVLRHETDAWIRFSGGHRWLCFSMSICQSSSAGTKDHSHWSYGQGSF